MITGIIKGLKTIKGSELGKEIGLAVVAGVVSWLVAEALTKYKNKKQG